ncbi:bZIP transcription factor ABI5 homolog isoform X2 [Phragmites australis]|uniref:bZIP transcription factor ABI5 homolog isoform X2 n=1 Tax=Phragmites australis TaxID=29695 RepID=UPI002D78681B|nr:bZIP transcription factor ABI5 homolog isoform X2 [Phragmites australis]
MASEVSKNVKVLNEQEVTSHQRDQSVRAGTSAAEEQSDPLALQSSILSLTLEELQNSLCEPGRNFGAMNMDEFMANIWNAEEFQATTGGCKGDLEEEAMATGTGESGGGGAGGSGLSRQGSFSLPPPLSRKTVDEVWAEISQGPVDAQAHAAPQAMVQPQMEIGGVAASGRQVTLGEMTLEDFLVKAGVVRGAFTDHGQAAAAVGMVPAGPMSHMQQVQLAAPMMFQVAPANAVYPVMGDGMGYHNGYPGGMVVVPPPPPSQCVAAAVSPGSSDGMSAMTQAEMMNCIGNGGMVRNGNARKRESPEDGCTEKTVERRQRRMIKNRESAARSRARKQAYTVELEAELNHLKEENARLRAEEVLRNKILVIYIFHCFSLLLCMDLIKHVVSVPFSFAEDDSVVKEKDAVGEDDGAVKGERER